MRHPAECQHSWLAAIAAEVVSMLTDRYNYAQYWYGVVPLPSIDFNVAMHFD